MDLYYRRDGSTHNDPIEFAAMLADPRSRRVALTIVGDVKVSTVFLGIDHGWGLTPYPLLFETMVFGGPFDDYQDRWTNEVAALAGHDQWVERVRDSLNSSGSARLSEESP
jgi:hypothetical protein